MKKTSDDGNIRSFEGCYYQLSENKVEYVDAVNNQENPEMGTRKIPFSRELYIDRDDFMENPPKKYFVFSREMK